MTEVCLFCQHRVFQTIIVTIFESHIEKPGIINETRIFGPTIYLCRKCYRDINNDNKHAILVRAIKHFIITYKTIPREVVGNLIYSIIGGVIEHRIQT